MLRKLLPIVLLWFVSEPIFASDEPSGLFDSIITAIIQADYSKFRENGTTEFRNGINEAQFLDVAATFGRKLGTGYSKEYKGQFKQQGFDVHIWNVDYESDHSNNLYKMVLDGDKVTGFWIH